MKTRILSFILCLLMLISLLSLVSCTPSTDHPEETTATDVTTQAKEQPEEDKPGFTYVVKDGKATITGYTGTDTEVVFPKYAGGVYVTAIGEAAFYGNDTFVKITLPGTIEDTGYMSFFQCKKLEVVVLSEGITSIADGSFNDCQKLREVTLPSTLTSIGDVAFQGSKSLSTITIPENVTSLGYRCFAFSGITSIVIPKACSQVNEGCFDNCRELKTAQILSNMKYFPQKLFHECLNLESVNIPDTVTYISDYALYRCEKLETLIFPEAFNYFGQYSLWGCIGLKSIILETTKMDRVCQRTFGFAPNLKDIYYAGTEESWYGMRKLDSYNEWLDSVTFHFNWKFENDQF